MVSVTLKCMCGRVMGYQYGSTDAVYPNDGSPNSRNDINSYYVDGVSITYGSPRQHVWTLMDGLHEATTVFGNGHYICPSSEGSRQHLQPFIPKEEYYCESGNPATDGTWQYILYTSDPLWDGKGCGRLEVKNCTDSSLPWFNKVLSATVTDYLELRVCGDEATATENVPVSFYELYVK